MLIKILSYLSEFYLAHQFSEYIIFYIYDTIIFKNDQ